MKSFARLILYFSLSFIILFVAAAGLRYLAIRVDWVRNLPRKPETMLTALTASVRWAVALALYGSILINLGYAARNRVLAFKASACFIALSLVFSLALFTFLDRTEHIPPVQDNVKVLGEPGLILGNAVRNSETTVVLIAGPADPRGPRVASILGQPLVFNAEPMGPNNTILSLPPIPFIDETPWFLKSLTIDLRLSAERLEGKFKAGLPSFLIYAGGLVILLTSFGCFFRLSHWPLANLFAGCLAFRGVLALETFLNTAEVEEIFVSFIGNRLPLPLVVPLIFCTAGLLIYIYSILVYLAKRQNDDYED